MGRLPAAQRREQLLDVAAKLFAERGYARTTTAQLAESAGVTEPIIYRHFKSKRDLFVALIRRAGRETLLTWKRHLRGAGDPAERLRRLLGDNPMVRPEGRDAYRVFLQAITEVDDEKIHEALADHIKMLHAFFVEELIRAQGEHKVTSKFPADLLAWMLIDLGLGYGVLAAMRIEGHGRATDGQHVQDAVTKLLVGQPGARRRRIRPPAASEKPGPTTRKTPRPKRPPRRPKPKD